MERPFRVVETPFMIIHQSLGGRDPSQSKSSWLSTPGAQLHVQLHLVSAHLCVTSALSSMNNCSFSLNFPAQTEKENVISTPSPIISSIAMKRETLSRIQSLLLKEQLWINFFIKKCRYCWHHNLSAKYTSGQPVTNGAYKMLGSQQVHYKGNYYCFEANSKLDSSSQKTNNNVIDS